MRIYLNDHLAVAAGLEDLAQRVANNNSGNSLGSLAQRLVQELGEERLELRAVMDDVGAGRNPVKVAAAWIGEKGGRLKLNGRLVTYSDLSRVIEIEALLSGVQAQDGLWRALLAAGLGDRERMEWFEGRAPGRRKALEAEHTRAVETAFRRATGGGAGMSGEPRAGPPGGPGESGPGEPGYEGRVTVGEEGAAVEPSAAEEPAGPPPEEHEVTDDELDDASRASFPASGPPSSSDPVDTFGVRDADVSVTRPEGE